MKGRGELRLSPIQPVSPSCITSRITATCLKNKDVNQHIASRVSVACGLAAFMMVEIYQEFRCRKILCVP